MTTVATILLAALVPGVQIDGHWLNAAEARERGLVLSESVSDGARRVTLENASGKEVRPEELGWTKDGRDAFDAAGMKVYIESWQMASPCGVRAWNDEPFDYSPGYLHNCVSTPSDFHPGEKGCFLADHMCCFRRPDGKMRLFGFTTGKDRFGHFRMKMDEKGVASLFALSACDRAVLEPGEKIVSEALVELEGDETEALFARYAARWARDSQARTRFAAPIGWCSWYYYFSNVTLADCIENADWFAAHRAEGFDRVKVFQLDDGYQIALGDWMTPNEKFPGGVPRFAKEIRARGFTPALWVGPFMVEENAQILKDHPEWLVKGADGKPAAPLTWRGNHKVYALDGTHPEVQNHLEKLFRDIRAAGIDYVKLDFCMIASSIQGAVYHDPKATRAQALRRGFEAIRRGFGEDGLILGCTAPFGPLVGIVDAMRSSTDITPYWQGNGHIYAEAPTVPNVCRNVINHNYFNGRIWVNDPDTLIVRDTETKLTQGEVELWTEAISLVGGSLLLSDRMSTLSPARLPLVKKALAESGTFKGTHPVDRWENTFPTRWSAVRDGRRVTTVFDFEKTHKAVRQSAAGVWVEEAGIRKFKVGRAPEATERECAEALTREPEDRTIRIDTDMTLDAVNDLEVRPGTKILFRRGGVWRGQLRPRSGKPGHPITYGAWGEGAKPVIEPSYDRSEARAWSRESDGLWKTSTGAAADIGNIILDHGKSGCAMKRNHRRQLVADLDFWCDPKTFDVYLFSARNPAERFSSIELAEKIHCIDQEKMHDVVYDSLALRYTAAHGVGGAGVRRIVIRNCDISWIGGGFLYFDKTGIGVRYGNGIEFWGACEDVLVESNRVWECWDAGLTNQSNGNDVHQCGVTYRGNEVWNCEYSYEYWQQGTGAVTKRVHVEDNVFRDAGKGWGHRQRWNPNAAHLMLYDTTAETTDFVISGNVFARSENCLIRLFNNWWKDLQMRDNRYETAGATLCRYHGRPKTGLVYRYPDRLDQMHDDNLAEIESQGSCADVFGPTPAEFERFRAFFGFEKRSKLLPDVRLKGYLGDRLDAMIERHVIGTDIDYITAIFREKTETKGWWQTEFWGKYMHSAMPYLEYTGSEKLRTAIDRGVMRVLATQEPNGYIGNYPDALRCGEGWDVWGMKYTMMGLLHYYDGTKNAKALAAAARVCDYVIAEIGPNGKRGRQLWETGNWSGFASSSILEPVMWLYKRTGEKKYLDFATYLVEGMTKPASGPRLLDLALKGISVADRNGYGSKAEAHGGYVMKHNRWKAYEMMSCYQGFLEYYEVTGRKDLFDAAVATGEQIIRDEINLAGGCACSEAWFHGRRKQHLPYVRLQETCVTTTWMRFCEKLLDLTDAPKWADEIERTFYNAYLAAMKADGSEFAGYTPLSGNRFHGQHHCFMHTDCCTANGPRGFLCFLRELFRTKDGAATINFYSSALMSGDLAGHKVAFDMYSLYPRKNSARIVSHTEGAGRFPLRLRIPAWSAKTVVKLNGKELSGAAAGTYFSVEHEWALGDIVEITFDMPVVAHTLGALDKYVPDAFEQHAAAPLGHYVAFTRGPVLLARESRFGDGDLTEPFRRGLRDGQVMPTFQSVRSPSDEIWMAFTATLPIGAHAENPEGALPASVNFCDYASAGNTWTRDNYYRTWFPVEWAPTE